MSELQVEKPERAGIQVQEQKLAFELFLATPSVRDAETEAQGRKVTCSNYSIVAQLGLEHRFPASFHMFTFLRQQGLIWCQFKVSGSVGPALRSRKAKRSSELQGGA